MEYKKYIGKLFQLNPSRIDSFSFPLNVGMAISELNSNGEVEILAITPARKFPTTLDIPLKANISGLFENGSVVHLGKRYYLDSSLLFKEVAPVDPAFLEEILRHLVRSETEKYYNLIHKPQQESGFIPSKTRIQYSGRVYDQNEMLNLIDASLDFYLTASRFEQNFCRKLSQILSSPDLPRVKVLTTNSGSSANLLAITSLTSPLLGDQALQEGDEVLTVAGGFPTTIAPIIQNRLVPVFVDIQQGTYNVDPSKIEEAITKKTKAIFVAHTLGIPFDLDQVLSIAEKYRLWFIEDNCDALGAQYQLRGKYELIRGKVVKGVGLTGSFGHIATSSFYPAHQITMGEGGAVYTSDLELARIIASIRDWGRDCWCLPGKDNTCGKRFEWQLGQLPKGYDHKYIYSHLGFNLKITDLQAAIGVAQLDKLLSFAKTRWKHWQMLLEGLKDLEEDLVLPCYPPNAKPSPFGFALALRDSHSSCRADITKFLESHKIQTRTVFAGNMLRQPAITHSNIKLRIGSSPLINSKDLVEDHYQLLPQTEHLMKDIFWIGVYPGLTDEMIQFVIQKIREIVTTVDKKKKDK